MKSNRIKSIFIAAVACACLAVPAISSAQRRGNDKWPLPNRIQNYRSLDDMVVRAERESNSFRYNFEHNYRGRDRNRNWRNDDYGFWGYDLKTDIQKMDEAFERLRGIVQKNNRHDDRYRDWRNGSWYDRDARREMETVVRYAQEVDRELGRGFGNYRRGQRNLTEDWRDLRRDIDVLAREFNIRVRW
jgi:hypothetical protein